MSNCLHIKNIQYFYDALQLRIKTEWSGCFGLHYLTFPVYNYAWMCLVRKENAPIRWLYHFFWFFSSLWWQTHWIDPVERRLVPGWDFQHVRKPRPVRPASAGEPCGEAISLENKLNYFYCISDLKKLFSIIDFYSISTSLKVVQPSIFGIICY